MKIAETVGLLELKASVLEQIGIIYGRQGNFVVSLEYFEKSLEINLSIGNKQGTTKNYLNLGNIYRDQGIYTKALELYLESLREFEEVNDLLGLILCYNNIGIIHNAQGSYDLAIEYYLKSFEICKKINNKREMAMCLNNIGNVYRNIESYGKALEFYKESLSIADELNDKRGIGISYGNIAIIYRLQGLHLLSTEYYQKALQIAEETRDKSGISRHLGNIALLYNSMGEVEESHEKKQNNYHQAIEYAEKALDIAMEIEALPLVNFNYNILSKAWEGMGNFKKAFQYLNLYNQTRDSLFNDDKTRAITEMQTRYETEKKQQEIKNQKLIIESQEIKNRQQRTRQNLLALISVFILFIAIISILGVIVIKRKNQKLSFSETELRQTVQTKDRLFSIIAHDLKSPFTALMGLTELISNRSIQMSMDELLEYSNLIHQSSKNLLVLIENLLMWSRSQTGRITFNPQHIKLGELVKSEVNILEVQAHNKGITITNNIFDKLNAFADIDMISVVFRNLVSNAIKFTPIGGSITLSSENLNNMIFISISDTGVGIPPEVLDKLFNTGESLSTKGTNNEAGTGLGLIICRDFVKKNGGTITVDSIIEKGTTFTFSLPEVPNT
jgi:signal transduction histidine kinase